MASAQFVKHLVRWTAPCVDYIVQSLPDSLVNVGAGGTVEQSLVGFRVLNNGRGLAVDSKNHGPLTLLHFSEKLSGFAPEICQRLNILGYVEHDDEPPLQYGT